jgi:hypothetical protein
MGLRNPRRHAPDLPVAFQWPFIAESERRTPNAEMLRRIARLKANRYNPDALSVRDSSIMSLLILRTVEEMEAAQLGENKGMIPWSITLAKALKSANTSFVFQMKRRARG